MRAGTTGSRTCEPVTVRASSSRRPNGSKHGSNAVEGREVNQGEEKINNLNRLATRARIAELAAVTEWLGEHQRDPALLAAAELVDLAKGDPEIADLRGSVVSAIRQRALAKLESWRG